MDEGAINTLNNILESGKFRSSSRIQDLLKYVFTETIEGRAELLSGTTIAQDVFEKGADFDSGQDTVVRVTASRLRTMLRDYYLEYPARDPFVLTIPTGGYEVVVEPNEHYPDGAPASKASKPRNLKPVFFLGGLLIFALVAFFGISKIGQGWQNASQQSGSGQVQAQTERNSYSVDDYPQIAVQRFENKTGVDEYDFLEDGLQKMVVTDLSRFELVRPVIFDDNYEALPTDNEPNQGPYKYAISGLILSVEPELDLYIKLVDLDNGSIVSEKRFQRSSNNAEYFSGLSEIVEELSGDLAGFDGAIVQANLKTIKTQIDQEIIGSSNLKTFKCLVLADNFFGSPNPAQYKTIYNCLEASLKREPDNALLLANFGALVFRGARSARLAQEARSIDPDVSGEDGVNMVRRAAQIDPDNGAVQRLLSSVLHMDRASPQEVLKHAELAYFYNRGDPYNMAWLSRRLASVGQWERALALSKEARGRTLISPANYYFTDFAWALLNDDKEGMRKAANIIGERGHFYDYLFQYLAAVANDDVDGMAKYRPRIDEMDARIKSRNKDGIMHAFELMFRNEDVISKARVLFAKAGVVSKSN